MLEGKEYEKQLGDYGSVSVDVTDKGIIEVALTAKVDIIAELEKIAVKTKNPIDDKVVAYLKEYLAKAA